MTDLTQAIAAHQIDEWQWLTFAENKCTCGERISPAIGAKHSYPEHLAAVVEAHLRPVVTTEDEVRDLPDGTVIRDRYSHVHVNCDGDWYEPADEVSTPASCISLPATVLYRPAD